MTIVDRIVFKFVICETRSYTLREYRIVREDFILSKASRVIDCNSWYGKIYNKNEREIGPETRCTFDERDT